MDSDGRAPLERFSTPCSGSSFDPLTPSATRIPKMLYACSEFLGALGGRHTECACYVTHASDDR